MVPEEAVVLPRRPLGGGQRCLRRPRRGAGGSRVAEISPSHPEGAARDGSPQAARASATPPDPALPLVSSSRRDTRSSALLAPDHPGLHGRRFEQVQELSETMKTQTEVVHMECKRSGEFAHRESTFYESGETFNGEVG